jgi:putative ABC transport system substrate-binding protein
MIKRREFITLLGGVVIAWPLATNAQQAMPVIGFLNGGTATEWKHLVEAYHRGLRELGYVEGQNFKRAPRKIALSENLPAGDSENT